ncbi:hypothetical protein ES703_107055 [subsurface metagenome]
MMIRLTIRLKKRALDSDLEKLRCALEDLKQAILESGLSIPKSVLRKLRRAGRRGARAGVKLRRKIRNKDESNL